MTLLKAVFVGKNLLPITYINTLPTINGCHLTAKTLEIGGLHGIEVEL